MPGAQELVTVLDLAGVRCAVDCSEPALWHRLGDRYAEFATVGPADLLLTVEVVRRPPAASRPRRGPYASVSVAGGRLTVAGADFQGVLDTATGRGRIRQPLAAAPFETFLTAVCAWRLLEHGGFLLHAAGLKDAEGAVVFFGPSGAGKSTVARLVGDGVISDEVVAVTPTAAGYQVSGLPWRGRRRSAPLVALYALRQAAETAFIPLRPALGARALLSSVFFPSADRASVARFLDTAANVLAGVPCYEMRFAPDRSFWLRLPHRGRPAAAREEEGATRVAL